MNIFFKTFFVCLVLTFSFLAYKFFSIDSYSSDLNVSKNNPVFGIHQDLKEAPSLDRAPQKHHENSATGNKVDSKNNIDNNVIVKNDVKHEHKCYFFSNSGELILVKRKLMFKPSLENSLAVLLKGPMIEEAKKGIYSEIPANVDVINITRLGNDIIVDLSANFGNGGGTNSIANRVKQLSKTIKIHEPNKNIYLYINGKEIEYLGGDGVYIKQPLD